MRTDFLNKKKLIVFDLDGTLFDSQLNFDSIRTELGVGPDIPLLEHINTLHDKQKKYFSAAICKMEEQYAEQGELYPEVPQLLNVLAKQKISLAIWTRNSAKATAIALGQYQTYFKIIMTRDHTQAKPHPQGLDHILIATQCAMNKALFIGDSEYDVIAAQNIGITTGIINPKLNKKFEKDKHIESLDSLTDLIGIISA